VTTPSSNQPQSRGDRPTILPLPSLATTSITSFSRSPSFLLLSFSSLPAIPPFITGASAKKQPPSRPFSIVSRSRSCAALSSPVPRPIGGRTSLTFVFWQSPTSRRKHPLAVFSVAVNHPPGSPTNIFTRALKLNPHQDTPPTTKNSERRTRGETPALASIKLSCDPLRDLL
jgi:hypothetical protein